MLGSAWEGSLPYAVDRTIVVMRPDGARRFTVTAPDRVVFLSAHSRGYAAVLADGRVLTISPAGSVLRERAFDARFVEAALLAAPGLILKTRDGLEIRNGDSVRELELPAGARFLGYSEGIAAYATQHLPHAREGGVPRRARETRNRLRLRRLRLVQRVDDRDRCGALSDGHPRVGVAR